MTDQQEQVASAREREIRRRLTVPSDGGDRDKEVAIATENPIVEPFGVVRLKNKTLFVGRTEVGILAVGGEDILSERHRGLLERDHRPETELHLENYEEVSVGICSSSDAVEVVSSYSMLRGGKSTNAFIVHYTEPGQEKEGLPQVYAERDFLWNFTHEGWAVGGIASGWTEYATLVLEDPNNPEHGLLLFVVPEDIPADPHNRFQWGLESRAGMTALLTKLGDELGSNPSSELKLALDCLDIAIERNLIRNSDGSELTQYQLAAHRMMVIAAVKLDRLKEADDLVPLYRESKLEQIVMIVQAKVDREGKRGAALLLDESLAQAQGRKEQPQGMRDIKEVLRKVEPSHEVVLDPEKTAEMAGSRVDQIGKRADVILERYPAGGVLKEQERRMLMNYYESLIGIVDTTPYLPVARKAYNLAIKIARNKAFGGHGTYIQATSDGRIESAYSSNNITDVYVSAAHTRMNIAIEQLTQIIDLNSLDPELAYARQLVQLKWRFRDGEHYSPEELQKYLITLSSRAIEERKKLVSSANAGGVLLEIQSLSTEYVTSCSVRELGSGRDPENTVLKECSDEVMEMLSRGHTGNFRDYFETLAEWCGQALVEGK